MFLSWGDACTLRPGRAFLITASPGPIPIPAPRGPSPPPPPPRPRPLPLPRPRPRPRPLPVSVPVFRQAIGGDGIGGSGPAVTAPSGGVYAVPVYRTQSRQHFVMSVGLRTKDPVQKWILAGVILVLEIK